MAQRIIAYQQELQQRISDMEMLLQQHNLLGELRGQRSRSADAPVLSPSALEKSRLASSFAAAAPLIGPEQIDRMLLHGIAEVGLGSAQVVVNEEIAVGDEVSVSAWAPLVLVKEGLWLDVILEAGDVSAVALFESLVGRIPSSERELLDFLAETFNLLMASIKSSLTEQGCAVLAPVIARSIRSAALTVKRSPLAEATRHRLSLPGSLITVIVLRQLAPVLHKSLGQLHETDVLAENLASPSTQEVFLLNQGVVLNLRYIEKLSSLAKAANKDLRVPVFEPSRLMEFFCLGRLGG